MEKMTLKEAYDRLQITRNYLDVKDADALDMAVKCIEKQMPKEICVDEYGWNECPNYCREDVLIKTDSKYCPNCGQRLSW